MAARYAVDVGDLRPLWVWMNQAPRSPGTTGIRTDAEILLNRAGQDVLARLCRVDQRSLERALPTWAQGPQAFREPAEDALLALARWQLGSAAHGPVAYGCRPCTARRTGQAQAVMRYRTGWQRVCGPHQRWALEACDGHGLEHLDLHRCPEIAAAQRRWPAVVRRAQRSGVEEGAVFAVARAVVCQWWDLALGWEQERIWPARLHRLAAGDAGPEFWWWRAVAREAATFPEVVAVAGALVDPVVAQLVWTDSGGERIRPFPPDGALCQKLSRRLARPWLGEVGAVPDSSALTAWWGALVRQRRGAGQGVRGSWPRGGSSARTNRSP
ncbi:hypothetical protein [Kitasatospora indigofera]|uniref:hypothetical protein n=1 Tax=Kitasatospora indigofera TaxID=67307 RepID=UPI0033A00776